MSYGGRVGGYAASAALSSRFKGAAAGGTRAEAMATPDGEELRPAGEGARENDDPMEERLSNKSKSACGL